MKGHSLYYKSRDELLEVVTDLKTKHIVSSPPKKYGGTIFVKKVCMGGDIKLFWANLWGNILHGN